MLLKEELLADDYHSQAVLKVEIPKPGGKGNVGSSSGRQGLLENKRVFVITARGGAYEKGTPSEKFDFQEPYFAPHFRLYRSHRCHVYPR